LGAGIDLHIAPFLSFRAIQLDYLATRFHSSTQVRKISRALPLAWSCASEKIAPPSCPPRAETGAATSRFAASSGAKG